MNANYERTGFSDVFAGSSRRASWLVLVALLALGLGVGCGGGCQGEAPPPEGTAVRGAGQGTSAGARALDQTLVGTPAQGVRVRPGADPPVARVGEEEIGRSQLEAQLAARIRAYERRGNQADAEWRNAQRRGIVRALVRDALLRLAVREAGVVIDDETVERALASEIETRFRSEERFAQHLERSGQSREEYTERLRFELGVEALLGDAPAESPDEAELRRFYDSRPERFSGPERARVATITARVGRRADEATTEAARAQLAALVERVRAGEPFGVVAREHSDGPERYRDGDLGWIHRGSEALEPAMDTLLFEGPLGAVSDPVRTRLGWQAFLVDARRPAGVPAFEEIRNEVREAWDRSRDEVRRDQLVRTLEGRYPVRSFEAVWGLE